MSFCYMIKYLHSGKSWTVLGLRGTRLSPCVIWTTHVLKHLTTNSDQTSQLYFFIKSFLYNSHTNNQDY